MGSEGWKAKLGGDTSGPTTLLLPLPPICLVLFFRTFREIGIQFCLGTYAFDAPFFKKGGRMSPKRIKSSGAEGWKGKIRGAAWVVGG